MLKLSLLLLVVTAIVPAFAQQSPFSGSGPIPFLGSTKVSLSAVVTKYRNSVIQLETEEIDGVTGAIATRYGTGFVLSRDGYVLTSGHLFKNMDASKARVRGRVGSLYNPASEELDVVQVWNNPDGALLKFRNTATLRVPIPLGNPGVVQDGAVLYIMGFPGDVEWFQDEGKVSGKGGPVGSWNTTISFEPGISGSPVLNEDGEAVAIAWGGVPGTVGTLNRVLPINLLVGLILAAGVQPNTDPPMNSLSPAEQIAKRMREGMMLNESDPELVFFLDGTTSAFVDSDPNFVYLRVSAPMAVGPYLRVLPGHDLPIVGGSEVSYGITASGASCVQQVLTPTSLSVCGSVQSAATVNVSHEVMRGQPYMTLKWKIPKSELGSGLRIARIAIVTKTGFYITSGYLKILW